MSLAALIMACAAAMAASPLDGRWQVNDGGPVLRFEQRQGRYAILWVDGPDLSIDEGTEIGFAVATANPGVFDCTAYRDPRGAKGNSGGRVQFMLEINAERPDIMTFKPYERKVSFNLRVLLPRWYRQSVNIVDSRPKSADGARRCDLIPEFTTL